MKKKKIKTSAKDYTVMVAITLLVDVAVPAESLEEALSIGQKFKQQELFELGNGIGFNDYVAEVTGVFK